MVKLTKYKNRKKRVWSSDMKKLFWFIIKHFKLGEYVGRFYFLNSIYTYSKYLFFRLINLLVKTDNKLIMISSYSGTKYDDSPKVIYEYLKSNSRFNNYRIFWVFKDPTAFNHLTDINKIKANSFKFYYMTLKARYFISNAQIGEGFYYKGSNTIYLNTWHGSAIKKIGIDRNPDYKSWIFQGEHMVDYFCAQSVYDQEVLSSAMQLDKSNILLTGLPRNDELAMCSGTSEMLKKIIGVSSNKKVILYAPTYRNYDQDNSLDYVAKHKVDFNKWKTVLSSNYIILYRTHYYITKSMIGEIDGEFVFDVSEYPYINDLIMGSDILVSDYSSLFFDYSITEKPMFSYAYDFDEYKEKVGVYIDIENELPNGVVKNEDELLSRIKHIDFSEESVKTKAFKEKYIQEYGHSTKNVVDFLFNDMKL